MTSHPKDLSDELIEVMAQSQKICKHLHLPVQSGSTRILEKMNRRYTKEHYLGLVEKIKAAVPDISLTTDIIVGFPGETEEDFQETLDVVRKVRYDSAFTFIYSKRTGTPGTVEHTPDFGFYRVKYPVQGELWFLLSFRTVRRKKRFRPAWNPFLKKLPTKITRSSLWRITAAPKRSSGITESFRRIPGSI